MFKKSLKFAGTFAMVGLLALPMLSPTLKSYAQEGDGELSEDELALIERVNAAFEATQGLTSVAVAEDETLTMDMNIALAGQEFVVSQATHKTTEGYGIRDGEVENQVAIFTVEHSEENPDGVTSYVLTGDSVFVDGVLYVNAAYEGEPEGEVEEIVEGYQMFESAEDLPAAFDELDFDNLFDDETDTLTQFMELTANAVSVESAEDELEDGTVVEVITITLDKEGFLAFLATTAEGDDSDEAMMGLFGAEESESGMTLSVALTEEDMIAYAMVTLNYSVAGLDAGALDATLEGATLDLTMVGEFAIGYAGYDEEFDPIVAPELEAEEE